MAQHQHHRRQLRYVQEHHPQQALNSCRGLVQVQDSGMPAVADSTDYRPPESADTAPSQQIMPNQVDRTGHRKLQAPPPPPHQQGELQLPSPFSPSELAAISPQSSFGQGLASVNSFPHRSSGGLLASVAEAPTPSLASTFNLAPETSGIVQLTQELGKSAPGEPAGKPRRNMTQPPLRLPAFVQDLRNLSLLSCTKGGDHSLRKDDARVSGRAALSTTQQGSSARAPGARGGEDGFDISGGPGNAHSPRPDAVNLLTRQGYGEANPTFAVDESLVGNRKYVGSDDGGGDKDNCSMSSATDGDCGNLAQTALVPIDDTDPVAGRNAVTSNNGVSAPPVLPDLEGSQSHKRSSLPAASTAHTSSRTSLASRTSAPSSPKPRALALVPVLAQRETDSECAVPQHSPLLHPLASTMLVNASSSFIRCMYDTGSSTGASCHLGDSEAMPSFAANLQKAGADSPDGCGATAAGNGEVFGGHTGGLVRADSDFCGLPQPPLVRNRCGRSKEGLPMLSRGFVTLHGNPMYLTYRSMTGEAPIVEEDGEGQGETCSGDGVAAAEDGAMAQSLELVTANTNSHTVRRSTTPPPVARGPSPAVPMSLPPSRQRRQPFGRQTAPAPPTCGSNTGIGSDASGGLFPGMPPSVALPPTTTHFLLMGGLAIATDGARRLSEGSQHWSMGAAVGTVNSSQPLPGPAVPAPSTFTAGGYHMSRNSSGGTTQAMMVASMESPASGVCSFQHSTANDEDLAPLASSQLSVSAPTQHASRAITSLASAAHAARTSLGASRAAGFGTALRSHLTSADTATLMKVGRGSSDGLLGGGSSGGAGGGTIHVTRRSGGGGMAAVLVAAPPMAPSSTLTARQRRASSGAIGVSLHAAAEAAISQMQPGSSFNRHSGFQYSAAAVGAPGSSLTRGLRKSASSWGRRNPGESRASASSSSPLNDATAAAVTATAAVASTGARSQRTVWRRALRSASETPGPVLSPAIEQLAALVSAQGGLDPRAFPLFDRGADAVCAAAPVGGVTLSRTTVASTLIRADGGLNTACGRGAAALRRSAPGHPLPVTGNIRIGGSNGTGATSGGGALPSARTSVSGTLYQASEPIRAPARSSAPDATANRLMAASTSAPVAMSGRLQANHGAAAGDASVVIASGIGCLAGLQRASDYHQAAIAGDHSIGAGSTGFVGRSRRSSTSSQVMYGAGGGSSPSHILLGHPFPQTQFQQPSPSHLVMTTTTSGYSRHGTVESLATPSHTGPPLPPVTAISRGGVPRTSCSLVVGGNAGGTAGMLPASGTAPSTLHGSLAGTSGGDNIAATRVTMQRCSTPELPSFMPLGAAEVPGGTVSPTPIGGGTGSGVVPFLQMGRLRASYQSLPEDIIAGVGTAAAAANATSICRELGRPSDSAAIQISNPGGLGLGPGTCRGSWWRSPRTQSVLLPGEEGSSSTGGGGGMGQGIASTVDKASHAPGSPEIGPGVPPVPGLSSGTGGIGAAGGNAAVKVEKESRPAVMAECYKITQQPTGGVGGGGGNEVAQSITMIKYTNVKQKLTRDDAEEPDDVLVPTNMLMVPTVSVEVAIWSLGVFRLKGVAESINIVQVLPMELEGRLAILNKAGLNRGKARCIEQRVTCLDVITLQLPDVSQLSCVAVAAAAAAVTAGGGGDEILPGCAESPAEYGVCSGKVDRLDQRGSEEMNTEGGDNVGIGGMEARGGAARQAPMPQLSPSVPHMQGLASSDGAAVAPLEAAERGGGSSPIIPGQATTSPADAGGRWADLQVQRRNDPLREVESSEMGLPPISEVATPISSPLPGSKEPMTAATTSTPGAGSRCDSVHPRERNLGSNPDANSTASLRHELDGASGSSGNPAQLQDLACGPSLGAAEAAPGPKFWGPSIQTGPGRPPYRRNATHRNYPQPQPMDPVGPYGGGGSETESIKSVSSTVDGRPSGISRAFDLQSPGALRAAGETTSAAPLSTGLLPSSLSYMAQRGTRDIMGAFAAMVSAGIVDIRSPSGSPVNTPTPVARSNMLLSHDSATAAGFAGRDTNPGIAEAANGGNS
ncbi:hypothetical protein Vretifemale_4728 [Volvox reticuliferus]|uniref:Uncharacterized protein n=1 Tax=Volvox reticuliferus TaxID=1737510 RepID=A0A8J4CA01_9CHLO|nr:hypothetical protein Vretifemale_4728 [Volvox reticuliferus]